MTYEITTTPYDGDSAKLHDYCVSQGFSFKTSIVEDKYMCIEFVVYSFEDYAEYLSSKTYYENYI